ncbi:hypothetical protein [Janthinobacterium psychrotolerans]|uniref:Uncharacterized protein n=1 Tax=Janthinobacterium psychrotolerans TaxID=1747903 RepID=A0A1A7C1H1_9BURK|nr:hypothetical protein [Janthinobacterium psychrotolerans]OBV38168.1 hypothetical protein ASR47_1005122 [Janthinobacterium psychrotolerans]
MKRKPASTADTSMGQHAMRLVYLCASLSPALAGLPHLMEYVWNYMMSASRATSK